MKFTRYLILAVALICTGCKPCECSEATLVGVEGVTLKITFDSSILPWVKDKFTITVIKAGTPSTLQGTYKETNDTIRFDVDKNDSFLSIKSGEINDLKCNTPRQGEFTITPPGGGVPVTFHCTKN
jgi:hypothetical protein